MDLASDYPALGGARILLYLAAGLVGALLDGLARWLARRLRRCRRAG